MTPSGRRDTLVTFEGRTGSQDPTFGTMAYTWAQVGEKEWADVKDLLGSERVTDGLNMANRPCQIECLYRSDITSDMRVTFDGRTLRIVRGPIEIGRAEGLRFVCENHSTEGQEP